MAKRTLEVGDLKITLSGPEAAVRGAQVNVNYILDDDPEQAVAAVEALGGPGEFSADGDHGRECLQLVPDFGNVDKVGVVISGPDANRHVSGDANEVLGRWKDRA